MKKDLITDKELKKRVYETIQSQGHANINCGNNLYVEVSPSGRAVYYARINVNKLTTRKLIGVYDQLTLAQARKQVESKIKETLKEKLNIDPDSNSKQPKKIITFENYFDQFVSSFLVIPGQENNTHKNNKRYYSIMSSKKHLTGLLHYPIDEITPTKVDEELSKLSCSIGCKYNAIKILNQCLNSAVGDGLMQFNACANMLKNTGTIAKKYAKPRVKGYPWVSADELKDKFFERVKNAPQINKVFYLLLALTCLRVGSLSAIKWEWIDFKKGTINIPAEFMKVPRDFVVPITPMIENTLKKWKDNCLQSKIDSPYVFFAKSSPSKQVRLTQMQEYVTACTEGTVTMHGIRKSARTWMAQMGISEEIAEQTLSHVSKNEIVRTYNKYNYLKERKVVLDIWNYYVYKNLPEEFKILVGDVSNDYLVYCQKACNEREKNITSYIYA